MALKFMGKKRGMMQLFDEQGNTIVCTVIEAEPNVVTQVKTPESDGYTAIQLGFELVKGGENRTAKPQRGHYKKAGVEPRRHLIESRLDKADEYAVGQEVGVDAFAVGAYVDVTGQSKGKGYQGVMKLHNFRGGRSSHGSSFHRHAGGTGMRTTPGRCFKNGKRASHMGDDQVTVQNLEVVMVDREQNLIMVSGPVPGTRNGLVYLSPAQKKGQSKGVKLWQQ